MPRRAALALIRARDAKVVMRLRLLFVLSVVLLNWGCQALWLPFASWFQSPWRADALSRWRQGSRAIIFQPAAVSALDEIVHNFAHLHANEDIVRVVALSGLTGVGKTYTSEVLAQSLLEDQTCKLTIS